MIKKQVFNGKTLIPYITYADPSPELSEALVIAAFDAGAAIVELGIPFSDPVADGPVIQASHQRALDSGVDCSLAAALKSVQRIKRTHSQPIVFMAACNLIESFGVSAFFESAAQHGLDGIIIPDIPVEEARDYIKASRQYKVDMIFLVSPLCKPDRLAKIVKTSRGFVYLISTTGTTGTRESVSSSLASLAQQIKQHSDRPIAVGFGVSHPDHVTTIHDFADGAIVGSHLVRIIHEHAHDPEACIQAFKTQIQALLS